MKWACERWYAGILQNRATTPARLGLTNVRIQLFQRTVLNQDIRDLRNVQTRPELSLQALLGNVGSLYRDVELAYNTSDSNIAPSRHRGLFLRIK